MQVGRVAAFGAALLVVAAAAASPAYAGRGAYWGTSVEPEPGQSNLQAIRSLESEIGRKFHIVRLYRPMDNADLDNDLADLMRARGNPVYLNVSSEIGKTCVPWKAVANGRYNRVLHRVARGVRHYRRRVYFSWNHEMQNTCNTGTPRQYRASYHRVHHIFRREHVRNAVWVWTPAAGNFNHDPAGLRRYLPRRYDLIGVDGYNRANPWRSATEIFSAAHRFAAKRGKRLFIGEVGNQEDPSDASHKAKWISNAAALFKRWNVGVVIWTNSPPSEGTYRADSSSAALAAYRAAGDMRYYRR